METANKDQLIKHLKGGEAFLPLSQFLDDISFGKLGIRTNDLPYSFYEIFYHIVFTQSDILDYCNNPDYAAPNWPNDYWPNARKPESRDAWEDLKSQYFEERVMLEELIRNRELSDTVTTSEDHSIFREVMLVIEHTAYHSGQLLILLRLLDEYDG